MRNSLLIVVALVFLVSCREEPNETQTNPSDQELAETIDGVTQRYVNLTPEAMGVVSQWLAFATAQNEVRDLRQATGHQIVNSSNPLTQIMESLSSTLPDTLKVVAVESRTTVLLTKAKVLQQRSSKKQREADEIFDAARDLISEFENFKLQLNERFLPSPSSFAEELDRQFQQARDSVQEFPPLEQESEIITQDGEEESDTTSM